jgi:hypothetical protein
MPATVTRYHTRSGSIYEVESSPNPLGTLQYRVRRTLDGDPGNGSARVTDEWKPVLWARDTGLGLVVVWDIEGTVARSTQTSPVTRVEEVVYQ